MMAERMDFRFHGNDTLRDFQVKTGLLFLPLIPHNDYAIFKLQYYV